MRVPKLWPAFGALCTLPVALAGAAAAVLAISAPSTATAQRAAAAQQAAIENLGKPVAPFSLEAEVLGPPAVGVPVDVQVTLASRVALEDIEVRISADPALAIDAASYLLLAPSASPDAPAEWQITVVPTAEGAHRLRLFGEALVGGERQSRIGVATIRVGTGAAAERDSTVRSAEDAGIGELRIGEAPPRRKTTSPDDGNADAAKPDPERVIRLPAIERR